MCFFSYIFLLHWFGAVHVDSSGDSSTFDYKLKLSPITIVSCARADAGHCRTTSFGGSWPQQTLNSSRRNFRIFAKSWTR